MLLSQRDVLARFRRDTHALESYSRNQEWRVWYASVLSRYGSDLLQDRRQLFLTPNRDTSHGLNCVNAKERSKQSANKCAHGKVVDGVCYACFANEHCGGLTIQAADSG